ncbi:MAG TPA: F0F1 ATP synthase subunit A [Candidatus Sulfotelmatobacter sp.]|nr:F0F1 ATP synthase subunit A [Candidatus Sulfotelmatobacter sp.]
MKLLIKSVLVFAFFAIVSSANLNAQVPAAPDASNAPAGTVVSNTSAAAQTSAPEQAGPSAAAETLYTVPGIGLPITNSMICTWIVALIILVVVRSTTSGRIKEIPSGMQNALESLVEGWESLMGNILDQRVTRWVFPFATTFFIFILVSNFIDMLPGVGSIGKVGPDGHFTPLFRPPTSDANLTVAMAAIFLAMSLFWAVRYNGVFGLIKHVFGVKAESNKWLFPIFFLLFLFIGLMDTISIVFARPVALAMRLYGNIFAGSTIIDLTVHMTSWLWAILLTVLAYGYDCFVCVVQAFVFAILVVAFVGTLCTHSEEPGH